MSIRVLRYGVSMYLTAGLQQVSENHAFAEANQPTPEYDMSMLVGSCDLLIVERLIHHLF